MVKFRALVLAGACVTALTASGCNRTLPAMEPYDEYKVRLKHPGDIQQSALPVLKSKEGSQPTNPDAKQ